MQITRPCTIDCLLPARHLHYRRLAAAGVYGSCSTHPADSTSGRHTQHRGLAATLRQATLLYLILRAAVMPRPAKRHLLTHLRLLQPPQAQYLKRQPQHHGWAPPFTPGNQGMVIPDPSTPPAPSATTFRHLFDLGKHHSTCGLLAHSLSMSTHAACACKSSGTVSVSTNSVSGSQDAHPMIISKQAAAF